MKGVRQPRESLRCQELFDGEVRKLYDSVAFPISDSNETSACDITASSASGGRKFSLNDGAAVASNWTAKISPSSSTRSGEWTPRGT